MREGRAEPDRLGAVDAEDGIGGRLGRGAGRGRPSPDGARASRGAGRAGPRSRSRTIASRSRARTACAAPVSGSPVETIQAVSSRWSQAITQSYRPSTTSGMARSSYRAAGSRSSTAP